MRALNRPRTAHPAAALPLASRRVRTQAGILAAVVALVVVGSTALGAVALLLTAGQSDALHAAMRRADPAAGDVEVYLRPAERGDAVVTDATALLTDALAGTRPEVTRWFTSDVRRLVLPGTPLTYLAGADVSDAADLVEGRWPAAADGVVEVAVPVVAADRLRLAVGDRVVLDELQDGMTEDPGPALDLRVVGTYQPRPQASVWSRDLLHGAQRTTSWEQPAIGSTPEPLVGPLVVVPDAVVDNDTVRAVSVVARPHLAGASGAGLQRVADAVNGLQGRVRDQLGDRTSTERVTSGLPALVRGARTQQAVTASAVVVSALLVAGLAAAALGLAGRLLVARRSPELRLLVARGADRRQLVSQAAAESAVLALAAAALAVPGAVGLYDVLTRVGPLHDAGLRAAGPDAPMMVTVSATAALLGAALLLPAWRASDTRPPTRRSGRVRVARLSAEGLLVAAAVVGALQLRSRSFASAGPDPVLVAAPLLALLAGTAVAARVLPLVARLGELRARRSRRLTGALAAWELARRPHATGAAALLALAAAAATFGVSLGATWATSAADQADTQVGTDLAVVRDDSDALTQAAVLAGTTGGTPVPVTDRDVVLGTPAGEVAPGTRLIAVDTTRSDELLRGRVPGRWADVTAGLAPAEPAAAIALPEGATQVRLSMVGSVTGTLTYRGTLTLVVQGPGGARQELTSSDEVPLDGQPHAVTLPLPDGAGEGLEVVGMTVGVDVDLDSVVDPFSVSPENQHVTVATTVEGAAAASGGTWSATPAAGSADVFRQTEVAAADGPDGATLTATADAAVLYLFGSPGALVLTGLGAPPDVPVVITRQLADAIAASPGDGLTLDLGDATVVGRVVRVAPALASLPHGASLLADADALSRAVLATGAPEDVVDGWWFTGVANPEDAAGRVEDAGAGVAETRASVAADLRENPLRAGFGAVLTLLVVAAGVLAVAGTTVQTATALESRALDVARLQGLGVARRTLVASLVLEHTLVSGLAVAGGGVVGLVAGTVVGPRLVVSATGGRPVPDARPEWPWPTQLGLLAGLLVLCTLVVAPVAARLVRRATAAHLRMDTP